jgi:mevalonate kinase
VAEAGGVLRLTVPSKSFFLGEYLALVGGRTLLAATLPRFELQVSPGSGAVRGVAPTSPAGRLLAAQTGILGTVDLEFTDPHAGAGGWGASAAQFLMCYAALERLRDFAACAPSVRIDVERMLSAYVDVAWDGRGYSPSGADIVAQLEGGIVEFARTDGVVRKHEWPFDDLEFFFVATGNKVATHQHLSDLRHVDAAVFSTQANSACAALVSRDSTRFVAAMRGYAAELQRQALVDADTVAILQHLDATPGVLASKGCGALGADVVVAIVRADAAATIESAIARDFAAPLGRTQLSGGLTIT